MADSTVYFVACHWRRNIGDLCRMSFRVTHHEKVINACLSQEIERKNVAIYTGVVETVIGILSGTNPCFILEMPTQHLRKKALDLIYYIGAKRLKLLKSALLYKLVKLFMCLYEDNEENFLLGFKIMLNLFRSEKLPPE
ncbi:hypothetical protein NPIL_98571, partial [Nephila pilipes]